MRPTGLEPMSGYRSSRAQISSRVRMCFVIFILRRVAQVVIAGKPSGISFCLLAKAMGEGFVFDEEMVRHAADPGKQCWPLRNPPSVASNAMEERHAHAINA